MAGCSSLSPYGSTVKTTEIVSQAMKAWSALSIDGNTAPDIDAKIIAAHKNYQLSAVVARDAKIMCKTNSDNGASVYAFHGARNAMVSLLDLVLPLLQAPEQAKLQAQLGRATEL